MSIGRRKIKEVITIDMVQRRLHQLSNFGWSIAEYLYTPQIILEEETWINLMEFFWEFSQNVQVSIIKTL